MIVTPPDPVPTAEARAALPAEVPMADAVHNIAHASLLVLGLATGDLSLVGARAGGPASTSRAASTSTRARWSWCGGPREFGAVGRVDLRRRADRAVLDPLGADRARPRGAAGGGGDCEVRRVQFAPGGADVTAL